MHIEDNGQEHQAFKAAIESALATSPTLQEFHQAVATVLVYARRAGSHNCGLSLSTATTIEGHPMVLFVGTPLADKCLELLQDTAVKILKFQHAHGLCSCEDDGEV